ncbi:efflux transporter outer membrane subunit [Bisgaard Taxon 46]
MQKPILALILTALLCGCQNTTVLVKSQVELPTQYEQAQYAQGKTAIQQWWNSWQDPQLSHLIQQGLEHNKDIAIAKSKLEEAKAITKMARGILFPTIGASGNASKAHIDVEQFDISSQILNGGISIAWEPDIFGQKQSDLYAANAAVIAQQAQIYGSQMLVANEIAHYYLKALHNHKQAVLLQQTGNALQQLERYLQGRFQAGQVTAYELNEMKSQRQGLKAKQATLQAQFDAYQRAIAVLTGQTPQAFKLDLAQMKKYDVLTKLPEAPKGTQPSELLQQRPDLQARSANIQIHAAKLASAKADLLPRFKLQFFWQTGQIELDSPIPTLSTWQNLFNASVQLPIFTAGRIQANIEKADEQLKQALLQYDQTLLKALTEVENRYQLQFALHKQAKLLQQTLNIQQKQTRDTQKLFQYGNQTFDRTIQARLSELTLKEKLLETQLAQGVNLINLYTAIGLGWQKDDPNN